MHQGVREEAMGVLCSSLSKEVLGFHYHATMYRKFSTAAHGMFCPAAEGELK